MKIQDFEKSINKRVNNLFTNRHCHLIYGLIRWLQPTSIVEIGCYHGYLTAWMAKGLEDNDNPEAMVYAIDNFSLQNDPCILHNNLVGLGVSHRVIVIPQDSQTMPAFPPCDFAMIDGDHSFEGAKADFIKALTAGAQWIVVHDTSSWWGPQQLVEWVEKEVAVNNLSMSKVDVSFDQGLTVFTIQDTKMEPYYSEKDYPTGKVN